MLRVCIREMTIIDSVRQPYVFAVLASLLAAALTFAYLTASNAPADTRKKATCKVLAVVLAANLGLTYVTQAKADAISVEPFLAD
jgi:hypothetical protein